MKKRVWSILLTLMLCVGALCVGAGAANLDGGYVDEGDDSCDRNCIAHATVPGLNPGQVWRWHVQSLDDIAHHLSASGEWNSKYKTVNVKFLSDVTTDQPFRINQCLTYVTLDLNGHTISGELSDSPVVEVDYDYGTQRVIIQNGTIKNTAQNGTALELSNGAATLEDVNVKGDLVLGTQFAQNPNYTPTFLGGGEFTKIRGAEDDPKGVWTRKLQSMLGKGCCFIDSAGDRINADQWLGSTGNSDIKELVNVRVMACDHKDDYGKYTLFVPAKTKYGTPAMCCTNCGNLCPHDKIDADLKCTTCKIPITIEATNLLNGKDIGPWYYTGLDDAMQEILHVHAGASPTLKLLADVDSACKVEWYKIGDKGLTIDLAGHTLTLTTDDNISRSDKMKFQNTSDVSGKVIGTVNVYTKADSGNLTLTIPDTHNNLTIDTLIFKKGGGASLAGGSFGSITISKDSRANTLADLLASGYYFADTDTDTDEPAALYDANWNALTTIENVTVKLCSHDKVVQGPRRHVEVPLRAENLCRQRDQGRNDDLLRGYAGGVQRRRRRSGEARRAAVPPENNHGPRKCDRDARPVRVLVLSRY